MEAARPAVPLPAGRAREPADTLPTGRARGPVREVFLAFLRLGLTSFGGPIAHLGYCRAEMVARRAWLDEGADAELVGLCQFLPGPASSQVGFAAWAGFTLPSAALAATPAGIGLGLARGIAP